MEVGDSGPVMTLLNKRLRALRKKQNRIAQIEENVGKGRSINKEQEEVLRSKLSVAILVEEYEKLRLLLPTAVKEELEKEREGGKAGAGAGADEREGEGEDVKEAILTSEGGTQVTENQVSETQVAETQVSEPSVEPLGPPLGQPLGENVVQTPLGTEEEEKDVVVHSGNVEELDNDIAELITLLYFGCLFDVRSRGGVELLPSLIWPKVHERSSCLSYDFVTEDSASPLKEEDLDALASLASFCTSRPPNATLSHRDALRQCARHALLWRRGSDLPIHAELLPLSYSHLKERLNRILSSEYLTMIPELQTVSQEEAEAAAGQYVTRVLAHEASARNDTLGGTPAFYSQQDESRDTEEYYEGGEDYDNSSGIGKAEIPESAKEPSIYEESSTEIKQQVLSEDETNQTVESKGVIMEPEPHVAPTSQALPHDQPSSRVSHMSVGPRGYPGSRDGTNRGGGGYGASGSRGGGRGYMYTNGRGSRARAGPPPSYSNGGGGGVGIVNYDQQGGYCQPRNYHGRGGRSGPRGGGNMGYNGQQPNGLNTTSTTLQST